VVPDVWAPPRVWGEAGSAAVVAEPSGVAAMAATRPAHRSGMAGGVRLSSAETSGFQSVGVGRELVGGVDDARDELDGVVIAAVRVSPVGL
jgi:hypothetical protein